MIGRSAARELERIIFFSDAVFAIAVTLLVLDIQPEHLKRTNTMRKIVVSEFVTLDGVMQAPGGADEDRAGGFKHGGWTSGSGNDFLAFKLAELAAADALLLGRVTMERRTTWEK